jgi:hypothetical protein
MTVTDFHFSVMYLRSSVRSTGHAISAGVRGRVVPNGSSNKKGRRGKRQPRPFPTMFLLNLQLRRRMARWTRVHGCWQC